MTKENDKSSFWTGIITGAVISILTALLTIWLQHSLTIKEKTTQLYLDEKKDFVLACNDYLKEYRQWHELMNYLVYYDTTNNSRLSEFKNYDSAVESYIQWKKNIDFAYGKIFMLSDNEFGTRTLNVSTVLHNSLSDIFHNNYDQNKKKSILFEVDNFFFENWLKKAQEEIFRFNSATRKQKTLDEFNNEQRQLAREVLITDSLNNQMYENLLSAYEYLTRKDSLAENAVHYRMPSEEEFKRLIENN
jgi:magnesium-transporting ATPase (P-type)